MAQANPGAFSSLTNAVIATGLAANLSGPGPWTVFAPTNTAFAAVPARITAVDVRASNGVTHVIDKILLPN